MNIYEKKSFIVNTCNTKHIENKSYTALEKNTATGYLKCNYTWWRDELKIVEIDGTSKARFIMILGIPQADPLRYPNRQNMRKKVYDYMKISNKVLSEMVFSHSRVCYNAKCKNVKKKTKKNISTCCVGKM